MEGPGGGAGREDRRGLLFGASAYLLWGIFPLYFKAVEHVPAMEVLAHRVLWSFLLLAALLTPLRRWGEVRRAAGAPRTLRLLFATTALIGTNWLLFIRAVQEDRVLEASLGYFIGPLVNVLLGVVVLGERLRRPQAVSVALAASGVLVLVARHGAVPWVSLVLAVTFGLYGLLRKTAPVESLPGLAVETALLSPPALGYLAWAARSGGGAFLAGSARDDLLLPLAGVVTAAPLLLFAAAARRLTLTTLGLLQYLSPTLHFVLAVGVFGEPFTGTHLAAFGFIWAGLALFSADAARQNRLADAAVRAGVTPPRRAPSRAPRDP